MLKGLGTCSALAMMSAFMMPAALAQTASQTASATPTPTPTSAANSDGSNGGMTDIVVTAQKNARAESIQRVPLAITAVNIGQVNQLQITDISQVARLAPNAELSTVGTFVGYPNFTIRGIGINSSLRTVDPGVIVIVDGMPLSFPAGQTLDTFDIGQIEILRGPQGVLQGRNATGGAVTLETRRPDNTFGVRGELRVGNGGRFDQSVSVEGPISGDALLGKVAVLHRYLTGLYGNESGATVPAKFNPSGTNPGDGRSQQRQDDWIVRPILVWKPTDTFTLTGIAEYIDMNDGGVSSRILPGTSLTTSPTTGSAFGYTPPSAVHVDHNCINDPGVLPLPNNGCEFSHITATRLNLEAELRIAGGLITSITGYRNARQVSIVDDDGTPFTFQNAYADDKGTQFSQEVRYASDFSDKFRFVVGGFYSTLDMTNFIDVFLKNTATNVLVLRNSFGDFHSKTYAAFGNLDLTIIPKLTLSAGARYTYDKKELTANLFVACATVAGTGCSTTFTNTADSWRNLSPRFAVTYQIAPDLMAYGSYSEGFRSGGFNERAGAVAGLQPAAPETAKTAEAGFRSTFWSHRARLNVTYFHTDYSDIQRIVLTGGLPATLLNAATARIQGVEVEASARPARGLEFDAALGWTDAKFTSFPTSASVTSVPVDQLKFDRVPEYTATVSGSYQFSVSSVPGNFVVATSYSWRDKQFSDVQNTPALLLPAYGLVDASIAYNPTKDLSILFYGRNLGNADYWDLATTTSSAGYAVGNIIYGGEPRSYGVQLSFKF